METRLQRRVYACNRPIRSLRRAVWRNLASSGNSRTKRSEARKCVSRNAQLSRHTQTVKDVGQDQAGDWQSWCKLPQLLLNSQPTPTSRPLLDAVTSVTNFLDDAHAERL
jgi:hypothetical protein